MVWTIFPAPELFATRYHLVRNLISTLIKIINQTYKTLEYNTKLWLLLELFTLTLQNRFLPTFDHLGMHTFNENANNFLAFCTSQEKLVHWKPWIHLKKYCVSEPRINFQLSWSNRGTSWKIVHIVVKSIDFNFGCFSVVFTEPRYFSGTSAMNNSVQEIESKTTHQRYFNIIHICIRIYVEI